MTGVDLAYAGPLEDGGQQCPCNLREDVATVERCLDVLDERPATIVHLTDMTTRADAWTDPRDGVGMIRAISLDGALRRPPTVSIHPSPKYL